MAGEPNGTPDLEALIADLRAKVEERTRAGEYPAGLRDDLAAHFRRLLERRDEPEGAPDVRGPLARVESSLPLASGRIPVDSRFPAGHALHKVVAKLVSRQTQGVLEQVQEFAEPARVTLEILVAMVEDLTREVREELLPQILGVVDRQKLLDPDSVVRSPAQDSATSLAGDDFLPWFSSQRFNDQFRGQRQELLDRYRDVAERLVGQGPVFEIGCGRGEFLELLGRIGVEARGVDLDPELVKLATERRLPVQYGDGLSVLARMEDASIGALVLIQVIEHLSQREVVELIDLAAAKVRPGGKVLVETVNPQSLYVFAHPFYVDPTHVRPVHPAYLSFLLREVGFAKTETEWRSPPPQEDILEEVDGLRDSLAALNANTRRLNELLFAPQDYLVVATR